MTQRTFFGPEEIICVGRTKEREAFSTLLRPTAEADALLRLIFVRGVGGIGKTTLSRRLMSDFLEIEPGTVALMLDCAGIPKNADIASILRLVARAADPESGPGHALMTAVSNLEKLAFTLRSAAPPTDSTDDDRRAWQTLKAAASEALIFFSAAALEHTLVGQPTSSSQSAIVSAIQAIAEVSRSARGALSEIANHLHRDQKISGEQLAIAQDPEAYIISTLRRFVTDLGGDNEIALMLDKTENILPQIHRLNDYFREAATGSRLTIIYSGRIEKIPVADGSDLYVDQYLTDFGVRALELTLSPFNSDDIVELLRETYSRRHRQEIPVPPGWIVSGLLSLSDGLPLWLGLLADTLTAERIDVWEQNVYAERLEELSRSDDDIQDIVGTLLRDLPVGDMAIDPFPMIAGLAIATGSAPNEVICKAAGFEDTAPLKTLSGRYGFMRYDRLHESVRSVVRQYLATSTEGRSIARKVATKMLDWAVARTPPDTILSNGSSRWFTFLQSRIELEIWRDPDRGIRRAAEYCITALPSRAPWIADLLFQVSWYVERMAISASTRRILTALSRATLPILVTRATLAGSRADLPESSARFLIAEGYRNSAYTVSFGRYLDALTTEFSGNDDASECLLSLSTERLSWLVTNGFDDDARELALSMIGGLAHLPADAFIRRRIGTAVASLIVSSYRLSPANDPSATKTLTECAQLTRQLVSFCPPVGAMLIRDTLDFLETDESFDETMRVLLSTLDQSGWDSASFDSLGEILLVAGRLEDASAIYSRGLHTQGDWISGWLGRVKSLYALGRTRSASETARRAADICLQMDLENLTEYGTDRLMELLSITVIVLATTSGAPETRAFIDDIPLELRQRLGAYCLFIAALFFNDLVQARANLESILSTLRLRGETSDDRYAGEIGLFLHRAGDEEKAQAYLERWARTPRSAYWQAFEMRLIRSACDAGWLPKSYLQLIDSKSISSQTKIASTDGI